MDESPRELVERARLGDRPAFAGLVRAYERSALAIAYAVVGDANTAGDVTQEAFLRAWQRLDELDDPERFGGWLGRIVRNLAADHLRQGTRPMRLGRDEDRMVDPVTEIGRSEQREKINAALAQLDELTRAAVVLRYYEQLHSKVIGELLGLSAAAVDMRLSRARTELREKLESLNPGMKCKT